MSVTQSFRRSPGAYLDSDHTNDPELYSQGIGTYCMLQTLELARRLEKRWAYFGYYVEGCGSLMYKARFRPCEIQDSDGVWRKPESTG